MVLLFGDGFGEFWEFGGSCSHELLGEIFDFVSDFGAGGEGIILTEKVDGGAAEDGGEKGGGLTGDENEMNVVTWFLEVFQEGIGGFEAEFVGGADEDKEVGSLAEFKARNE